MAIAQPASAAGLLERRLRRALSRIPSVPPFAGLILFSLLLSLTVGYFIYTTTQPVVASPVAVVGDVTLRVTRSTLRSGVIIYLPSNATAAATADGLAPFVLTPATPPPSIAHAPLVRTLTLVPGSNLASGSYLAAIVNLNDANGTTDKITVDVTDGPFWPLVCVFLGLIIAYGVNWYESTYRPGRKLMEGAFTLLLEIADREIDGDVDRDPKNQVEFSIVATANQLVGLKPKDPNGPTNDLRAPQITVLDAIKTGDLATANTVLQSLRTLFADFESFTYTARDVATLAISIAPQVQMVGRPSPVGAEQSPRALAAWEELIGKHPYPIADDDDLKDLRSQVQVFQAVFTALARIVPRYREACKLAVQLEKTIPAEIDDPASDEVVKPPKANPDFHKLTLATSELDAIWQDLWLAQTSDALSNWKVESRLEDQVATLRSLAPPQPIRPNVVGIEVSLRPITDLEMRFPRLEELKGVVESWKQRQAAIEEHTGSSRHAKTEKDQYLHLLRTLNFLVDLGDYAVVSICILAAMVTGMNTLYVAHPFGSALDYLGTLAWGVGVDGSVVGLLAILGKLGATHPTNLPNA